MKELGRYLKITRNENGVSIEEAADDLNIEVSDIENIEKGNVKAFKDVYELRFNILNYAKYLGLNPNKVADEFNEFLFEHTSKISVKDVKETAKKRKEQEEKRIKSPYTMDYKPKKNLKPIFVFLAGVLVLSLILFIFLKLINRQPVRNTELKGVRYSSYEYTN